MRKINMVGKITAKLPLTGARIRLKSGEVGTVLNDGKRYILMSKGKEIHFSESEMKEIGEDVRHRCGHLGIPFCTMASLSN